ncbi:GtrA family protein [Geodermatophilus sp. SYSU D00691]
MASPAICGPCGRPGRAWQVAVCGTRARLHQDDAVAEFARFVTVGVSSSLVYFALFLALRGTGALPANAVAFVVSTVLANELHRRVTFHAGGRVGWLAAQWESGGLAVAGLAATSLALAALDGTLGTAWWADVVLIAAVTGAIGLVRFAALRLWVFSGHAHRPAPSPS